MKFAIIFHLVLIVFLNINTLTFENSHYEIFFIKFKELNLKNI